MAGRVARPVPATLTPMSNTVTLVLDGREVSLDAFAEAVTRFRAVVEGLTREEASGDRVVWMIDNLDTSSAVIGARGIGEEVVVEAVVRRYDRLGASLQRGSIGDVPPQIREAAAALADLVDRGGVESIRFHSENTDAVVTAASHAALAQQRPLQFLPRVPYEAYGAVEGRVQTLSSRNQYRFTLYDTIHDKAVSCYLLPSDEDVMRDSWGHLALVEGIVRRDGETGRPLTVRQVQRVVLIPEGERGAWRAARGVSPATGDRLPEDAIRALRDA